MKPVEHGTIVRISIAMLATMGSGLVAGTAALVNLSNASEQHRKDITELKHRLVALERIREDIAVTREKVENIERMLERRK
jgi:hypothetical protein